MKKGLLYTLALLFASIQAYAQIYTYDANNKLTKVEYGNGVTVSYEYDVLGNRTSRKVTGSIAETYTITVSAVPSNYGTVSGGGTYGIGTNIEINASPYAGFEFEKWNDGSTVNPRTITVTKDQSFTAHFMMSETANNYDANGDGVVNSYDLDAIIDAYLGDAPATAATDIDGDGVLTIADASILIVQLNDTHTDNYNGHEYVDLGLPSGTLWATCNVGASTPEEYGSYFAWAETEEKDVYDWSTYKWCNGSRDTMTKYCTDSNYGDNGFTDGLTELLPEDDAASANWGAPWHMPTLDQIEELLDNCTRTWTQQNGVNGTLVTGPNGNTIFLPAAGYRWSGTLRHEGSYGYYWSSLLCPNNEGSAYRLTFGSDYWCRNTIPRNYGLPVRSVITPEKPKEYPVAEAIDLGLPSGTKWASWNVGASKPEEYGGYYAWGETEEKDIYNEVTYMYASGLDEDGNGLYDDYHSDTKLLGVWLHIGDDIAGTEYDVAHMKWGDSWRMPSDDQIQELMDNCERTWTRQNGTNGILLTGPNGNSVFLPAAGSRSNDDLINEGSYGGFWSSSLYSLRENHADVLSIDDGENVRLTASKRNWGRSIRAVITPEEKPQDCPVAEAIDLGLPSGTKWANWNVGASAPEEYGGYYAWGETEEKDYYDWSTYTHCDGSWETCHHIGDDIAGTEYDVAHVKWGGLWRMPTKAQQDELRENCTREWTQMNGMNGIKVTGPNGSSIFLPAAGYRWDGHLSSEGSGGYYWSLSLSPRSENLADYLYFDSDYWKWGNGHVRSGGLSVRAVIIPEETPQDCPVAEAIDLGLPSGTKWASWNIGASKPEEYGGYFAWGETEEKDVYDWNTYTHCDGSEETCHDIGDDIAGTQYDVAHEKWGGSWTMPSLDQIKELIDNCTQTWTTQNDVNGILVTGPNNATIFLPAAGCRRNDVLNGENYYGYYWTSSLYSDDEYHAYHFRFLPDVWGWYRYYRYGGRSVRAVCP